MDVELTRERAEAAADRTLEMLERLGRPVRASDRILDFGCGEGALVAALLNRGLDVHGADFPDALPPLEQRSDRLRAISTDV